jgi:hypothetical protein
LVRITKDPHVPTVSADLWGRSSGNSDVRSGGAYGDFMNESKDVPVEMIECGSKRVDADEVRRWDSENVITMESSESLLLLLLLLLLSS